MHVMTVTIAGMQCEHCKRAVFTALAAVEGIERADVQLGRVTVEHNGSVTSQAISDAIGVVGYTVTSSTDSHARRSLPVV